MSNRRVIHTILIVSLGLNVVAFVAAMVWNDQAHRVRSERFEIVDADGVLAGWLGIVPEAGEAAAGERPPPGAELVFTLGTGAPRMRLAADGQGARLTSFDDHGQVVAELAVDVVGARVVLERDGGRVVLAATDAAARVEVATRQGAVELTSDARGATVRALSAESSGGEVELRADTSGVRLATGHAGQHLELTQSSTGASLTMGDDAGRIAFATTATTASVTLEAGGEALRLSTGTGDQGITLRSPEGTTLRWPEVTP